MSKEEQKRIGKEVGRILGRLFSDKREFDITAYYSTNSPTEQSVWHKNAHIASMLVDEFLTDEYTDTLVKIVIELSPKHEKNTPDK